MAHPAAEPNETNPQPPKPSPQVLNHATITSLPQSSFPTASRGTVTWQTLLSAPSTPTNALTVGIARCAPLDAQSPSYLALHRHAQAEIYHVIAGRGVVVIDGAEHGVSAGDVVYIPGDAEHGVWNVSASEELRWLYCFAVDGFGEVVYRFSGEEGGDGQGS